MDEKILLSHGGGGKTMHRLVKELLISSFSNPILNKLDDSAVFNLKGKLAFTTDSFVVKPLFFPGGDIGKLAICGTINDLAMVGAKPLYLTLAFIIEEGIQIKTFKKVIDSIKKAADETGIKIVAGDLKVVEKNSADQIFINTSGIGLIPPGVDISGANACAGDAIIINGFIADHGAAVMCARGDYKLKSKISSDCAPLNNLVAQILKVSKDVHVLRDPTRGGVATTLNEIALASKVEIEIDESLLPIKEETRGFCEILGIDPLYMANEGKILVFVAEKNAKKVLHQMYKHRYGKHARIIGRVTKKSSPLVLIRTAIGSRRILDMLTSEQLPRIC